MISEHISDDLPPKMKVLNMVIPILMQFCSFGLKLEHFKPHNAACHPMKCDVIDDIIFPTVSQFFDVIQLEVVLQKQVH